MLYEFLTARAPFESDDVMETYRRILRVDVDYTDMDQTGADLIRAMLRSDPTARLPYAFSVGENVGIVKRHRFFSSRGGGRRGALSTGAGAVVGSGAGGGPGGSSEQSARAAAWWLRLERMQVRSPFVPFDQKKFVSCGTSVAGSQAVLALIAEHNEEVVRLSSSSRRKSSGGDHGARTTSDDEEPRRSTTCDDEKLMRELRSSTLANFAEVPEHELVQHNYGGKNELPVVAPGWDRFF